MATSVFLNPSATASNPFDQELNTSDDVGFQRIDIIGNLVAADTAQINLEANFASTKPPAFYQITAAINNTTATNQTELSAWSSYNTHSGASTISDFYVAFAGLEVAAPSTVTRFYGYKSYLDNSGTVGTSYHYHADLVAVGTLSTNYAFYATAAVGPTNSYSFWSDERGVARIRTDALDGAGNEQAIYALYNPRVTKYTPGAANYERIITGQWVNNVAQIGTEAGGTGTLRAVTFIGAGFTFTTPVTVSATNIVTDTTTGMKIGTATTQKLGFYNATPIVQGASVADASGGATIDAEARTAINTLISRIEALGLIATV